MGSILHAVWPSILLFSRNGAVQPENPAIQLLGYMLLANLNNIKSGRSPKTP